MRYIFALILAGMMMGCGSPAQQYILSQPTGNVTGMRHYVSQIGVDKVAVPAYLAGNKIPIQSAEGELTFCDSAVWATAPEKGLTQHAIAYLQKSFSTPRVYRYPWDIEHTNGVRLHLALTRLVYVEQDNAVVLEASYFVESLLGKRRRAKLFSVTVPVAKGETPRIVVAMNRAFDRLLADAARAIAHF